MYNFLPKKKETINFKQHTIQSNGNGYYIIKLDSEPQNPIWITLKKDFYDNLSCSEEYIDTLAIDDVVNKTSKEVYSKYCDWCNREGVKPDAKNKFSSMIQNTFEVKSITCRYNGKPTKVYKDVT